ncbi:FtsK/SpoIIIE domain-containing protein [Streptomyces sp. NPDC014623]|uniref:FtsK/SpoIIIE domain-containing protein n=1 Tax=Streptomyces sp. NPDC014623 TaxID=3364875 RepID=UPI0036FA90E1
MSKRKSKAQAEDDMWGQAAGGIGVLVMVTGGLAAVKDKLGLSWPATLALCVGTLIALGYAAWRIKNSVKRRWASEPAAKPSTAGKETSAAVEQASPSEGLEEEQESVPAHPELTRALVRTGAIEKDQIIALSDVETRHLDVGTQYKFLLPRSKTHERVADRLGPIASMLDVTRLHLKLETSRTNERHVTLLVLKEPPFSHLFDQPSREDIRAFNGIPFGHDVTGELAGVPTLEGTAVLISGMSQTGKTTLACGIITCLLIAYGDEFDMVLLDGKFLGLADFAKIALRYESSSDPEVLEELLDFLIPIVDKRYEAGREAKFKRQPPPKFRPLLFIIDEAADFYANTGSPEAKKLFHRVEEKSRYVTSKGLECGVAVIMMTQRPDKDAIPTLVRSQLQLRICLYVDSEGTAKVSLGDSYFTTTSPIKPQLLNPQIKGQAVLFSHGKSTLIRGFNFPSSFVWKVIDEAHARQQNRIVAAPETPLTKAIKIMQDKGLDFIPTVDLAPLLDVEVDEEKPSVAGQKLSKMLGVRSAKRDGNTGPRGYRLADLTAALGARP